MTTKDAIRITREIRKMKQDLTEMMNETEGNVTPWLSSAHVRLTNAEDVMMGTIGRAIFDDDDRWSESGGG